MPEFRTKALVHNRFDIEIKDAKTGIIKQKAYAENILLDQFWTRYMGSGSVFSAIHLGTGSGTLSAARTSLFSFLLAKAVGGATYNRNLTEGWISSRAAIQLIETENVGAVLSEIGVGYDTTSSHLVTHALLKDMNGNPVTIEKTSTDIITFYATIYMVFPVDNFDSGHIKVKILGGVPLASYSQIGYYINQGYAVSGGLLNGESALGTEYPLSADPSWTITKNATNKTITTTGRLAAASGNFNGGLLALDSATGLFKIRFRGASGISGNAIVGESLGTGNGVTKDFTTAFPFIKTGAKVYVDSVEQTSGVTIDQGKPKVNDLLYFCDSLDKSEQALSPIKSYGRSTSVAAGKWEIVENTLYQTYGVDTLSLTGMSAQASDDLVNWTSVSAGEVAAGNKNKRYWKFTTTGGSYRRVDSMINSSLSDLTNIHFDVEPANGAAITIDYEPEVLAKDVNHVIDFTFVVQYGEYTQ